MPAPVEHPPLGWLLTLTATGLEVALPVSASTAVAVMLWLPSLTVVESQKNCAGYLARSGRA